MVPLGAACLIVALPVAAYAVVAALLGTSPHAGRGGAELATPGDRR